MIKDPYNITLTSTKKNIFTIILVAAIIFIGVLLMNFKGFNSNYLLSRADSDITDGFSYETYLYVANFVYALLMIIVALAIIVIRHDILGVISGLILFAFIFLALVVGVEYKSGGIAGVHESENITLTTMVVNELTKSKN